MSYADPDHAAALWETCSVVTAGGDCPQVLTWTSDGWETSRAMVIPDKLNIYALRDGSVVVRVSPEAAFIVRPDRSRRAITVVRHSIAAEPGDRLTNLPSIDGAVPVGMLEPGTATLYKPLAPSSSHCLLNSLWDAHGRVWDWTCDRATGDTAVQSSSNPWSNLVYPHGRSVPDPGPGRDTRQNCCAARHGSAGTTVRSGWARHHLRRRKHLAPRCHPAVGHRSRAAANSPRAVLHRYHYPGGTLPRERGNVMGGQPTVDGISARPTKPAHCDERDHRGPGDMCQRRRPRVRLDRRRDHLAHSHPPTLTTH
jgi:hypothetical protein